MNTRTSNVFTRLAATNRPKFVQIRRMYQKECHTFPRRMVELEISEDATKGEKNPPVRAWRSRDFLAQQYHEGDDIRITINRTDIDNDGRWRDGITWDDIQRVKREIGYGDVWAVEIFPADQHLVNVARMRHIWLCQQPAFAWTLADNDQRSGSPRATQQDEHGGDSPASAEVP